MRWIVRTYDRLEGRLGQDGLGAFGRSDTGRTYEGLEVDDPETPRGSAEDLGGYNVSLNRGNWRVAYLGM